MALDGRMVVKSVVDYLDSMTPRGASVYALMFLGVVLVSLGMSGEGGIFPAYLFVFCMFLFTCWYIYVKLIMPSPLQL
jgi:hypothetical protein